MAATGSVDRSRAAARPTGVSFDEVLEAALRGDAWAWEGLYAELAPAVLGYLRGQRAPNPEDLLGEVFLQVVRDLHTFEGTEARFRSWVFTIAHHRILDARRYHQRRPVEPADATTIAGALPSAEADPEADVLEHLTTEDIRLLTQVLTEDQRTALLLRVLAGLTIGEIAEVMDKKAGAVKQLQRRGIATLRAELQQSAYPRREAWALTKAT